MIFRRAISLILVATTCVSTAACSTPSSVDLSSDPSESDTLQRLDSGERIEIAGYTRVSDGHRDWNGHAQLAPPDSIQFTPRSSSTLSRPRMSFKLHRAEIASLEVVGVSLDQSGSEMSAEEARGRSQRSQERTLTIVLFLVVVGAAAVGYAASGQ
jgi:hypothetical protein